LEERCYVQLSGWFFPDDDEDDIDDEDDGECDDDAEDDR
jgi:hypothetical protein